MALDDMYFLSLPMDLEILFNNRLVGDPLIQGSTLLCIFCPCILQRSEDPHVKQLEFVSCFQGEAVNNDRGTGSVAEPLHFGKSM